MCCSAGWSRRKLQTIMHCVRTIMHCIRTIMHCVRTIMHCIRTIMHCVRTIMHCVRTIMHCVKSVLHRAASSWTHLLLSQLGGGADMNIYCRNSESLCENISEYNFFTVQGEWVREGGVMTSAGVGGREGEEDNSILHQRERTNERGARRRRRRRRRLMLRTNEGRETLRHTDKKERGRERAAGDFNLIWACVCAISWLEHTGWRAEPWWGRITCWPLSLWTMMVRPQVLMFTCCWRKSQFTLCRNVRRRKKLAWELANWLQTHGSNFLSWKSVFKITSCFHRLATVTKEGRSSVLCYICLTCDRSQKVPARCGFSLQTWGLDLIMSWFGS